MSYYTPYNTIEIWDLAEYNSLPRRWLNPSDNPNAQRKPIQQSSIPLSDITDWSLYEPSDENWNDWRIDNFREVEVDGLAYANDSRIARAERQLCMGVDNTKQC